MLISEPLLTMKPEWYSLQRTPPENLKHEMAVELQLVIPSMSWADGSDPTEGQLLQQGEVSKKKKKNITMWRLYR